MPAQTASLLPNAKQQFLDVNGVPLAGGKVYFYIPNTSTLKNTWQDPYQNTLNPNPVILDSAGEAVIYGSGQYRQVVQDALDNTIWDQLTQDLLQLFNLPATTRVRLSAPQNYYVSGTGSDSGNGTSMSPWLTMQHAANYIQTNIDTNQFPVEVLCADGSYTGNLSVTGPFIGGGTVQFTGDVSTPANCVVSTTNANCFEAFQGAVYYIRGFRMQTTTSGDCVHMDTGGQIIINGNVDYGVCAGNHNSSLSTGSQINITSPYTISGGAVVHWNTYKSGSLTAKNLTITLTGTPAFTIFSQAIGDTTQQISGNTFNGSATGQRFFIAANSFLDTQNDSLTYLPGSTAGVQATGGVYADIAPALAFANFGVIEFFYNPSPVTYTPSPNMLWCYVRCVGGGGSGGSAIGGSGGAGSGGGAGGYCEDYYSAATIGASQVVVTGAAGVGVTGGTGANGNAGGNTTFGPFMTASGGQGGFSDTGTRQPGGAGGMGFGGRLSVQGQPGGPSIPVAYGIGGWGGSGPFGVGGYANSSGGGGANASGLGAGGSGAQNNNLASGNGSPGFVIIIEYDS